jgi:hypothetical protein
MWRERDCSFCAGVSVVVVVFFCNICVLLLLLMLISFGMILILMNGTFSILFCLDYIYIIILNSTIYWLLWSCYE